MSYRVKVDGDLAAIAPEFAERVTKAASDRLGVKDVTLSFAVVIEGHSAANDIADERALAQRVQKAIAGSGATSARIDGATLRADLLAENVEG